MRPMRLEAVRCITPVCARLTVFEVGKPAPERCPVCAGPVEAFELRRPERRKP
jgi:rubrerythrin